ncbi:MAG: hypothetical protein ABFD07_18555 [Methanobacterium sp.]
MDKIYRAIIYKNECEPNSKKVIFLGKMEENEVKDWVKKYSKGKCKNFLLSLHIEISQNGLFWITDFNNGWWKDTDEVIQDLIETILSCFPNSKKIYKLRKLQKLYCKSDLPCKAMVEAVKIFAYIRDTRAHTNNTIRSIIASCINNEDEDTQMKINGALQIAMKLKTLTKSMTKCNFDCTCCKEK